MCEYPGYLVELFCHPGPRFCVTLGWGHDWYHRGDFISMTMNIKKLNDSPSLQFNSGWSVSAWTSKGHVNLTRPSVSIWRGGPDSWATGSRDGNHSFDISAWRMQIFWYLTQSKFNIYIEFYTSANTTKFVLKDTDPLNLPLAKWKPYKLYIIFRR